MNRVEARVRSLEAVRPLEIVGAEDPVACLDNVATAAGIAAVMIAVRYVHLVDNARYAVVQTPGRRAFATRECGLFQRVDVIGSLRGRSSVLSADELIDIAGIA
jgi:hypothetical protein